MNAARRPDDRRGSALVIVLILTLILVGFTTAFLSRGVRETVAGAGYRIVARTRYAAEGLLDRAKVAIRSSPVDTEGRNQLLAEVFANDQILLLADSTPAVNEISGRTYHRLLQTEVGTVWVTRFAGEYVRLEAEATIGTETCRLAETIVERVPVTTFVRLSPGLGALPSAFWIGHGVDSFRTGDEIAVEPLPTELSAADADARRAAIDAPTAPSPEDVAVVAPPGFFEIPALGDRMFGTLRNLVPADLLFGAAEGYMVELEGSLVRVTEYVSEGPPPAPVERQIPDSDGVLYLMADVLSISGDVDGRLTIVSDGEVHVTGSLRYVDEDGDPAMLGGGEAGPTWEPNPDYDGDTVLGIIARGSIFYSPSMPSHSEVDAALLSQTGTIGLQLFWWHETLGLNLGGWGKPIRFDAYTARGKAGLKEFGAKISAGMPVTKVRDTDLGFAEIVSLYDVGLRFRPPPGFPRLPLTETLSRRRVGGVQAHVEGGPNLVTRTTGAVRPTVTDTSRFEAARAAVRESLGDYGVEVGE